MNHFQGSTGALWKDKRLSLHEKLVLMVLHDSRGEETGIAPREADIANTVALSRRSICRAIRSLREGGWIQVTPGDFNSYKILPKAWDLLGRTGAHPNNL